MAPLSLLMCDLDHFKSINDQFGHARGDAVLVAAGRALATSVRASDFVGRYGGEEFLVLLPETDAAAARVIAEKVRAAVAGARGPALERQVTMSIGLAEFPRHALDADSLQRAADQALYAAKENGRNRVEVAPSAEGARNDVPVISSLG
jgi:diguanylate cyclase (GGDEF)-like protein